MQTWWLCPEPALPPAVLYALCNKNFWQHEKIVWNSIFWPAALFCQSNIYFRNSWGRQAIGAGDSERKCDKVSCKQMLAVNGIVLPFSKGWIWHCVLQVLRDLLPLLLDPVAQDLWPKVPRNSTSLTLLPACCLPNTKIPLSQESSCSGHLSGQGAQLSPCWQHKLQREALCTHKESSEWLPEGHLDWEEY